ncbi:tripartite tricarboxylate transporter substrate binding protein [Oceanisphaera sp. IT1-181]|uniref:Bug family tripartite tricarboxylate transporter substrate binding protein n=1 Tax=Oceanisphaera sp. IT1-181 TaxID=3081199 RepID=UPI0029C9DBAC|nr:tripartite tricarboxylate transporter substrate binding protein [Oceanisphaera sp. IT1-181]
MKRSNNKTTTKPARNLFRILLAGCLLGTTTFVQASYPERAISVVAAYAPGGSSDIAARTFSQALERQLGTNVIVENKAGAGGIVGTDYVYRSKPDGYKLLLARVAVLSVAPVMQEVPYDPNAFTYLGMISVDPYTCVTGKDKPYNNIDELRAAVVQTPGKLTYSSSGNGTLTQIATIELLKALGAENPRFAATHIPYQGEGPALAAVAGGHVDLFCGNLAPIRPQIESGMVKAIFITGDEKIEGLEDIPSTQEIGLPELETLVGWSAIVGPPNMDEAAKQVLIDAMQGVKADEEWRQRVKNLGSIATVLEPQETYDFAKEQYTRFSALVEEFDLKF